MNKNSIFHIRNLVLMGILGGLAAVLMLLQIPVPFAPGFYQLDFSELPVLVGAFAIGPMAGVIIEVIKILVNLLLNSTKTSFIGEAANLLMGLAFILPASMLYQWKKTKKNALIGLGIGVIIASIVACLANLYILIPLYIGPDFTMDKLVAMGTDKNTSITNLNTLILYATLPFNLLKFSLVSFATAVLYKHIAPLIKGVHRANNN